MQEDIAGTQTSDTRSSYGTCAECGTVYRRRDGHIEPSGLTDDVRSEFTELCPDCEKLNLQGERPVVGEPYL